VATIKKAHAAGDFMSDDIARRDVKALVFDVFGTVVDWRTSLIDELSQWAKAKKIEADWTALVDAWREAYVPSMNEVRNNPAKGFVKLDLLHRQSLDTLIERFNIKGLSEADRDHINRGWHRLKPWPDSVSGLTRLKTKFIISPLSNGNVLLLTSMGKNAGLPWDLILGAEVFEHYKPDPETYLGAARLLSMQPAEVMMVAAHNNDLKAAQACGLRTAFVPRPTEYGPNQKRDTEATGDWTMVVKDFGDLATRLGC
jgi:2-haloacid dehalogenase